MAPSATRTISCKAWNSSVEYASRESKHSWHNRVRRQHVQSNIQRHGPGGRNIQGGAELQNQNDHVSERLMMQVKTNRNGHKIPVIVTTIRLPPPPPPPPPPTHPPPTPTPPPPPHPTPPPNSMDIVLTLFISARWVWYTPKLLHYT